MVPELPVLPEGQNLPEIDPKAKGGWQGPDDLVVSITPLWPRPNRSWRWIVQWVLMVATCFYTVLVPTAMRNNLLVEAELAIARHVLSTGFSDVSSPATFWTWLHDKWLPQLHQYRHSFPPSGVLMYDLHQQPIIGAYGNSYIARPRPQEDPLREDGGNAAFWGVGMVLRQHRVRMTNCSSIFGGVDGYIPIEMMEPSARQEALLEGEGKCYEKFQLKSSDSWELTQYTTTVRFKFSPSECAKGCSNFGVGGCKVFVVTDGDSILTARYTDARISGAKVPPDHPLLPTNKELQPSFPARYSTCFMSSGENKPIDCTDKFVGNAEDAPSRGDACVNGVKMTAFRPGACPAGAHLCAPLYSKANLDIRAKRWGGREGYGFRAAGGGWNRRLSAAGNEEVSAKENQLRALYSLDVVSLATSNSTPGANSSKAGVGGLDVSRYGDPWDYTEGPGRLWGGPWSGTGDVVGRMEVYPGGGYGVDLLQEGGVAGITSDLEKSGWIDRATRAVSLDFWVVLPLSGVTTKATILFELAGGGRWIPSLSMRSGPLPAAAIQLDAAANAEDASRPSKGVGSLPVDRGIGVWFAMEVVMIVLQTCVVVFAFLWGSAYSLKFHPRALVPRFVFFVVGYVYRLLATVWRSMRKCWSACCKVTGNLAAKSAEVGKAMDENAGIKKKVSPKRKIKQGWVQGEDGEAMVSVMNARSDDEQDTLRHGARLKDDARLEDIIHAEGNPDGRPAISRGSNLVSPSEIETIQEQVTKQEYMNDRMNDRMSDHQMNDHHNNPRDRVHKSKRNGGAPGVGEAAHLGWGTQKQDSEEKKGGLAGALQALSVAGSRVQSARAAFSRVVSSKKDNSEGRATTGQAKLGSNSAEALQDHWLAGELWPLWDAVCVILLTSRLMLEVLRVFGGAARASGGRGPGSQSETGWSVGGGDFHMQLDNAAAADAMGAGGFLLLLFGGVRFWRSSRVMVMMHRLITKSAAPACASILLVATILCANASRTVLMNVHTPHCQPSRGQMLATALDQLLAFDGAGVATEAQPRAYTRVSASNLWRRGSPARDAARAAWATDTRSGLGGGSTGRWGVIGSRQQWQKSGPGGTCEAEGLGLWPSPSTPNDSSHWIRSINEMMTFFEVFLTALIVGPLLFSVILHCWHVTTLPETRNMRQPTDKESKLYQNILGQDLDIFWDWACWMWYEIKEQTWAWQHSVPRDFLELPAKPPFDPNFDASEYEPYTDADCWRSVYEVLHRTDAEVDERLRAASCLMLRTVAPLIASLDKMKHLPIDVEEQPYATAAGRSAAQAYAAAAAQGAASPSSPRDRESAALGGPSPRAPSMLNQSGERSREGDGDWELEDVNDLGVQSLTVANVSGSGLYAGAGDDELDDDDYDSDISDVATPLEAREHVPKGLDLRVVVKVEQLRGASKLKLPKEIGSRKAAKTLSEHFTAGNGLFFDFRLHGHLRSATWEGVNPDNPK